MADSKKKQLKRKRKPTPKEFQFDRETRHELRQRFPAEVVESLENAANDYKPYREATSSRWQQKRDIRKITTRAETLKRAIEEAHPRIRFSLLGFRHGLDSLLVQCAVPTRKPKDTRRRQLEHRIGQVLRKYQIKLTTTRGGDLEKALELVLYAVVGSAPQEDRLHQICRRVRDDVDAEATARVELNRVFD